MPRQPYEEVIANVKKWGAPEVTLRKDFEVKLGDPVILKTFSRILGIHMAGLLTTQQCDELAAVYKLAAEGRKFLDNELEDLMEQYRATKYDKSRKLFYIIAVLKYADGTGECYSVCVPSNVLELKQNDFWSEVSRPQAKKIYNKIAKEAAYTNVVGYTLLCYQI